MIYGQSELAFVHKDGLSNAMPDNKHIRWVDNYGTEAESRPKAEEAAAGKDRAAANDADGWQQYRRWISKAPVPRGRRAGIDPALYSWKGYRDWSDRIKRSWSRED